jgi:hypothetical protein
VEWFFTVLLVLAELAVTGYLILCCHRLYVRHR